MNLQREFFLRVEELDQQREAIGVGNLAKDRLSILRPKFVQRFAAQRTVCDDALRFRAIHDLPRFTDAFVCRKIFSKQLSQFAAAPNPLLEDWFEGEGDGEIALTHAKISGTVAAAVPAATGLY